MTEDLRRSSVTTTRHTTSYLETGPADGPLMVFLHGWPEIGLLWQRQLRHFAGQGWRCIAPDLRGYGGSSVPQQISAYTVREITADMVELHDALGGEPAVWVAHDWGAAIAWSLASHHPERCRGVAALSVPYLARGFALPTLVPLVDRSIYPESEYPVGQWDYWLFYRQEFAHAAHTMGDDVPRALSALFTKSPPADVTAPAITARMRERGGWFGSAPLPPADPAATMLAADEFDALVTAFESTGFSGADAWYVNDADNLAHAAEAVAFGRLTLPVLFLQGAWDTVCQTVVGRLADPMRADCADLTVETIQSGHMLMLEQPDAVDTAIDDWLSAKGLDA